MAVGGGTRQNPPAVPERGTSSSTKPPPGARRVGATNRVRNAMPDYRLISADSHVSEPPDLWVTRVDKKYRERAPRLAVDLPGKAGAYFLYEGYAPHPIGIGFGAGKSPEELQTFLTQVTYADARKGGWDPAARKEDNAVDGVEAD